MRANISAERLFLHLITSAMGMEKKKQIPKIAKVADVAVIVIIVIIVDKNNDERTNNE